MKINVCLNYIRIFIRTHSSKQNISFLISLFCLDRNEPARFFGDGVVFKAKLIGILEVGEARGDRMCQEALQDLKIAIRAAGEHKQRITIHVTIEGLRLRDEKTGVRWKCIYEISLNLFIIAILAIKFNLN